MELSTRVKEARKAGRRAAEDGHKRVEVLIDGGRRGWCLAHQLKPGASGPVRVRPIGQDSGPAMIVSRKAVTPITGEVG